MRLQVDRAEPGLHHADRAGVRSKLRKGHRPLPEGVIHGPLQPDKLCAKRLGGIFHAAEAGLDDVGLGGCQRE